MYLRRKDDGDAVEVLDLEALFDPNQGDVEGRLHAGEEMQEPETFAKTGLEFPSGEALPRCWTDPHYRQAG